MSAASADARPRRPYGLAFAIEDLTEMRGWADARDLVMLVTLDRVINGAEFEEMIVLSPRGRPTRRMALWRSFGTVFAQPPHTRPRGFTTVTQALDWLSPPRRLPRRRIFTIWSDWRAARTGSGVKPGQSALSA